MLVISVHIVNDTILVAVLVVWLTVSPSLIVSPRAAVGPHKGSCSVFTSTSDPSYLVVTSVFIAQFSLHKIVDLFSGYRSKMTPFAFAETFSVGPIVFVFAEIVAAVTLLVPATWTGDGAGGLTV